jgi:very-short-patch-repair endonuclease
MRELIRRIIREQTKEIDRPYVRWTPEMVHDIAKKYTRRGDFGINDGPAYKWAKDHGIFDKVTSHMEEPKNARSDSKSFIDKSKKIHGDQYDYSKVDYTTSINKVTITCPIHGDFFQKPNDHLKGKGCPGCGVIKLNDIRKASRRTPQEFINKSQIVHNGKYDYSKTNYIDAKEKVIIICPIHGEFLQSPDRHLYGNGCPKCGDQRVGQKSFDDFLKNASNIHGDKYDYSKVNYKDTLSKITITCPIHGDFEQTPGSHIRLERGCPICKESKGEKLISSILLKYKIDNIREKRFLDCVNISGSKKCTQLPFDFYLPNLNVCIEYDGKHHFMAIDYYGGEESFKRQQVRDKLKDQYCKENGIKLIRIPYTMNKEDIEPYILQELGL